MEPTELTELTDNDLTVLVIVSDGTQEIGIKRINKSNGAGPTDDSPRPLWARKTWRAPSPEVLSDALSPVFGDSANDSVHVTCKGYLKVDDELVSLRFSKERWWIGGNLKDACSKASGAMGWDELTWWDFGTVSPLSGDPGITVSVRVHPVQGQVGIDKVVDYVLSESRYTVIDLDDGGVMKCAMKAEKEDQE